MKADLSLVLDLEVSLHHRLIRVTVADHRYREASIIIRTTAKTTPIIITRQSRITQAVGITMSITIVVVSTTTAGIRCWQRHGFQVVGTLPGAFRHKQLGYVDALVMIQGLVEGPTP